jgi:short-subunit dehydrogenase
LVVFFSQVLSKTCERLNKLGTGKAEYITSDLSSQAGCAALCDEVKKRFEKIHVLVNNSGMAIAGEFHQYPEKGRRIGSVFTISAPSLDRSRYFMPVIRR